MPTPSELRVARLRDQLADRDFLVHEVVDCDPTTSDEEEGLDEGTEGAPNQELRKGEDDGGDDGGDEEDGEGEGEGSLEGSFNANQSGSSNHNGLGNGMTAGEVAALNRDVREKRLWEEVDKKNKAAAPFKAFGEVERSGREGKASVSPAGKNEHCYGVD